MTESESNPQKSKNRLRQGSLGVAAITFFVISAAAPLTGIAGGTPVGMLLGNGAGVPFAFLLITLLLLVFSVGYTRIARYINNAGSFYAFASQGFNGRIGAATAYTAMLAYITMQIGLYGLFGAVTEGTIGALFGLYLPWYLYAGFCVLLISIMGYRKIELSMKILTLLVILEYLAVFILDLLIVGKGGASGNGIGMTSFSLHALLSGTPILGFLLCFASFMGFESTTIYSEEAREPKKTVPRATYAAVLAIGIFYTVTTWLMVEGAGAERLVETIAGLKTPDGVPDPTLFIYSLTDKYAGSWLTLPIQLLFVSSLFAALLAFHNATSRYFYVLGREGLLPSHLGHTHEIHQSPHKSSIMQTIISILFVALFALSGIDPVLGMFTWMTNTGTLAIISIMALVSFAISSYSLRMSDQGKEFFTMSVMPVFAGVLMTMIAVLVSRNFDILIGADPAKPYTVVMAYLLPLSVPAAAVFGFIIGSILAKRNPSAYRELGKNQID
ncbi:MAG: APC family permease [Candidatus Pacebacteria bacterium]|nr:APC family permease [Candidatus Paceibacterota bacterium]